jgi:hypothetical protein
MKQRCKLLASLCTLQSRPEFIGFVSSLTLAMPLCRRRLGRPVSTGFRTHLSRGTNVSATIGRDYVVDRIVGNRRPRTVHFNLVVVTNHATLGRPTIHQIAARAPAGSARPRVVRGGRVILFIGC